MNKHTTTIHTICMSKTERFLSILLLAGLILFVTPVKAEDPCKLTGALAAALPPEVLAACAIANARNQVVNHDLKTDITQVPYVPVPQPAWVHCALLGTNNNTKISCDNLKTVFGAYSHPVNAPLDACYNQSSCVLKIKPQRIIYSSSAGAFTGSSFGSDTTVTDAFLGTGTDSLDVFTGGGGGGGGDADDSGVFD